MCINFHIKNYKKCIVIITNKKKCEISKFIPKFIADFANFKEYKLIELVICIFELRDCDSILGTADI